MTASARSGKKTGPGRLRRMARPRATTRMTASAMRKILTFRRKASGMTESDSLKTSPSKNARFTSGQPGAFVITSSATTANTIVLARATRMLRERPGAVNWLLEDGRRGALDPLLRYLVERAGLPQGRDRLVDAVAEWVALFEDEAEILLPLRGEPADRRCVRRLDRSDEERGRVVDDDAVDLTVPECVDGIVVSVVDRRILVRLDRVDDGVVARRSHLRAELRAAELSERCGTCEVRVLEDDDRLLDVVVGIAEVDGLVTGRHVRDLVDVEVEVLRARTEGGGEGNDDPFDLVVGEAQLLRHRVSDGGFVALLGRLRRRVPWSPLGVLEPGREGGIVGPDRQRAVVHERELLGRARIRLRRAGVDRPRGGRLVGRRLVVVPAAPCGDAEERREEQERQELAHAVSGGPRGTPTLPHAPGRSGPQVALAAATRRATPISQAERA